MYRRHKDLNRRESEKHVVLNHKEKSLEIKAKNLFNILSDFECGSKN